ncbi:hypothetical protein [Thermospira aquatica]|uniref:Uncharacterized protein n=1 Tax=Thermospira aquatica TaxID=2828656 RepID=A0AAX3BD66_9SPIR|nr:hypothetical protein [Thermospira aquatica]URA10053.1 hypothetical protein KDW03_11305 [Thermospira aquatica]
MRFVCAIGLLVTSFMWGGSVWNTPDTSLYTVRVEEGDIVLVVFSEKTVLKLKEEQKNTANENSTPVYGRGGVLNFYPEGEAVEQINKKNQRQYSLSQEKRLVLPARVVSREGKFFKLAGQFQSDIGGQTYHFLFEGEAMLRFLQANMTIPSSALYNLRFQLLQEDKTREPFFIDSDLLFKTNYTDIKTNLVVSNAQTNVVVETNQSSYELVLKGISEDKKKQLILQYLNRLVEMIVRE